MASKTILICDCCKVQFDMSDPHWPTLPSHKRYPLYPVTITIGHGVGNSVREIERMVCEHCRETFKLLIKDWVG